MAELVRDRRTCAPHENSAGCRLLHGDCLTVTGKTVAENLKNAPSYPAGQEIIRPLSNPIKKDSHLVVLYGNLLQTGAIAEDQWQKRGFNLRARPACSIPKKRRWRKILDGSIRKGDVIVIRFEGPKGGPWNARKCSAPPRRSWAAAWEKMSRSLPTADFREAATALSLATSRPRRNVGDRWQLSRMVTASPLMPRSAR